MIAPIAISFASALISGCSTESLYHSLRLYQQDECNRDPDFESRRRCLDDQATPYDRYQRERASKPVDPASAPQPKSAAGIPVRTN